MGLSLDIHKIRIPFIAQVNIIRFSNLSCYLKEETPFKHDITIFTSRNHSNMSIGKKISKILVKVNAKLKTSKKDLEICVGKTRHVKNVLPLSRKNQDSLLHCPQLWQRVVMLTLFYSCNADFVDVTTKNSQKLAGRILLQRLRLRCYATVFALTQHRKHNSTLTHSHYKA